MRVIILHYHLFKNAGTSVDKILKNNFKNKWITREFTGSNNTDQVTSWILSNPEAIAFSSHTMNGPIPQIDGVRIISIAMLRDPIQRITSAYKFERNQDADTWGAQLAKQVTFEDYVVARLQRQGDTQCRNFQTSRLSTLSPGPEDRLKRALLSLEKISLVGVVEDFHKTLDAMKEVIKKYFPDFNYEMVHSNRSSLFDFELTPALEQLLLECNRMDRRLWQTAQEKLKTTKG